MPNQNNPDGCKLTHSSPFRSLSSVVKQQPASVMAVTYAGQNNNGGLMGRKSKSWVDLYCCGAPNNKQKRVQGSAWVSILLVPAKNFKSFSHSEFSGDSTKKTFLTLFFHFSLDSDWITTPIATWENRLPNFLILHFTTLIYFNMFLTIAFPHKSTCDTY